MYILYLADRGRPVPVGHVLLQARRKIGGVLSWPPPEKLSANLRVFGQMGAAKDEAMSGPCYSGRKPAIARKG